MVVALLFIAPVAYDLLNGQGQVTTSTFLTGAATVVAPFLLMWLAHRVYFRPARYRSPELPQQDYVFALLPTGWMVGAPETVTFYDWRDVEAFYENQSSWIIACLANAS